MANAHANKKCINKLLAQLNTFVDKFDTTLPTVLREFKHSFSKMPGDLSKLYNSVQGLIEYIHKEKDTIVKAVDSNKYSHISNNVRHMAEELGSVDVEVGKLRNRYKDNDALQIAAKHFHKLNSDLRKVINAIINAASNLINKSDRLPDGKYHDHTQGFRIAEDRILKKAKGGAF